MARVLIAVALLLMLGCKTLEEKIQDVRDGKLEYHVTTDEAIEAVYGEPDFKQQFWALPGIPITREDWTWRRHELWRYGVNWYIFRNTYLHMWAVDGKKYGAPTLISTRTWITMKD